MADHPEKPIEEVLPTAQLLAHYKARIDEFEAEREELLRAVSRCAVQADELHCLEWENRKRADEVRELQQALSDAQQFLFEERQRLLGLQAENDDLKLRELDDRRRMQHLLAVAAPLEQSVTYRADGGAPTAETAPPPAGSPGGKGGVMRTVFLPAANADALLLRIESLQAQLNEQRELAEERVEALLVDRRVRREEEDRHRANGLVQVEALTNKVAQLEETLRQTTRDYIEARAARQAAEERAASASARMACEVEAARQEGARQQRAARSETREASAAAERRMREYMDRFREQVRARDEELTNLSALHERTKSASDKRIADLEQRAAALTESNRQLQLRRQLDADGWGADVALLRKQVASVDRKLLQMRLIDRLEDDERLDALLDQLQKKAPPVAGAKQQRQQRPRGGGGGGGAAGGRGDSEDDAGYGAGGDEDDTAGGFGGGPAPSGAAAGGGGGPLAPPSVAGQLAAEMRAVRRQLEALEARAADKAERAGVRPRVVGAHARRR